MTDTTEQVACQAVRALVNVEVKASFPWIRPDCRAGHHQWERHATRLESAVKDFEAFLRDHRSQDEICLEVDRQFEDVCSACNATWEPWEDEGVAYCPACGALVMKTKGEGDE